MAQTINIATKQSGDTLTAGELNQIVTGTNAAITEQNETKSAHAAAIANRVEKVTGKGLSTEDFTTAEKQKLAGVAAGATADTGATIKTKLEALTGDARLDASAVKNLPEGGGSATLYLEVTYAQAVAAMAAATLVPGTTYKITDRGDRGLFFTAISTTQFAATGTRLMLCPATYATGADVHGNNWLGIWHSGLTPAINNLVIWGGHVWKNLTGVVGSANDDITLDATNWVLVPKATFANGEYVELLFGVQFDWTNDWISKQCDDKGNEFGLDWTWNYDPNYGWSYQFNPMDHSDWNLSTSGNEFHTNRCLYVMNNNVLWGIYNNVAKGIYNNSVKIISDNIIMSEIRNNTNDGYICQNIVDSITDNKNAGNIERNHTRLGILGNENQGHIRNNNILGEISMNMSTGPCNIEYNGTSTLHIQAGFFSTHVTDNPVTKQ